MMAPEPPAVLLVATTRLGTRVYCRGRGCRRTIEPGEPVHDVGYDDGDRMYERAALCADCLARLGDRVRPVEPPACVPTGVPADVPQW